MIRLLHFVVVCAFIAAAVYVYKIKFDSIASAERLAKVRLEIKRERDNIATLRAEWSKLENPARIQALTQRHLPLKPIAQHQFDRLDRLPERPAEIVPPDSPDPIAVIIENSDSEVTGSVPTETRSE
jgi:hypothetical protein